MHRATGLNPSNEAQSSVVILQKDVQKEIFPRDAHLGGPAESAFCALSATTKSIKR